MAGTGTICLSRRERDAYKMPEVVSTHPHIQRKTSGHLIPTVVINRATDTTQEDKA